VSVLFVVVPIALALVVVAIAAFLWSVKRGQFDDMVTPAMRALHDEPRARDAGDEREKGESATS
jgi:cbb3-type cytochrome oxidase maturation protein